MSGSVPPDNRSPPIETLTQQLATLRSDADQSTEAFHRSIRDDEARRWIAKTIIWIFTGSILAVLGLLLLQGWRTNDWDSVTTRSSDLIKSAVLPVVTLVLGYYFGRADKS